MDTQIMVAMLLGAIIGAFWGFLFGKMHPTKNQKMIYYYMGRIDEREGKKPDIKLT